MRPIPNALLQKALSYLKTKLIYHQRQSIDLIRITGRIYINYLLILDKSIYKELEKFFDRGMFSP